MHRVPQPLWLAVITEPSHTGHWVGAVRRQAGGILLRREAKRKPESPKRVTPAFLEKKSLAANVNAAFVGCTDGHLMCRARAVPPPYDRDVNNNKERGPE